MYLSSEKSQATENKPCKNALYYLPIKKLYMDRQTDRQKKTHTHTILFLTSL